MNEINYNPYFPDTEELENSARYKFWRYMNDQHSLLLTESEIDDIIGFVEEIQKENHIVETNEKVFQMPKLKTSAGTIYDVFKIMTDGDGIIHAWTTNTTGQRHWINFDEFELVV